MAEPLSPAFDYFANVIGAGDVDADGFADVLVGEPFHTSVPRVYLYLGSPRGLVGDPARTWNGPADEEGRYGAASCAGDFDGDGLREVVVAAPRPWPSGSSVPEIVRVYAAE